MGVLFPCSLPGQSSQFSDRLQLEGATVIEMPDLEIGSPSNWQALDDASAHLSDFNWLILTSTNGVDYFFERLETPGKDARGLAGVYTQSPFVHTSSLG